MILFMTIALFAIFISIKPKPVKNIDALLNISLPIVLMYSMSYILINSIVMGEMNHSLLILVMFGLYSMYSTMYIFQCSATDLKSSITLLIYILTLIYSSIIIYTMISNIESLKIKGFQII